jgi:hypothetical protein
MTITTEDVVVAAVVDVVVVNPKISLKSTRNYKKVLENVFLQLFP